jgi:aryl-alcohol dehydrogenase-like predicted oxidoreductase
MRSLGGIAVTEIGLGCMNLSHGYGLPPSPEEGRGVIERALELGVTHFDTAALYGFGKNETLVGATLAPVRQQIHLASKCGFAVGENGYSVEGRPESLRQTCHESLKRLGTDVIDLYYLHRWDKRYPIEESVGVLRDLLKEGHIRSIGLSEVSAATLRRAHAVHPIAAVQNEYSIWTRNPEIALIDECDRLGVTLVAFSPLTRGYLLGAVGDPSELLAKDFRRDLPRFAEPHFSANRPRLQAFQQLATEAGCTPAQLALAWILQRAPRSIVIPGTRSIAHLEDNLAASRVRLSADILARLEALFPPGDSQGPRYGEKAQSQVDTEQFPG